MRKCDKIEMRVLINIEIKKGQTENMIFIYYEHINDELDKKVQELAEKIRGEGIVVKAGCKVPQKVNHIIVLVESIWEYIEGTQTNPEFENILYEIGENPHKIICVSYQKCENFRNISYVKKRDVLFLMNDYDRLLKIIKTVRVLGKLNRVIKIFIYRRRVLLALFSLGSLPLIIIEYNLKKLDIPEPQLEIKWEFLSAYDYNGIIELNNTKVVKKEKPIIKELIMLNKNENVIVGVIVIKNNKEEYPEKMKVDLERIQDGHTVKDEINLKTVSHNDYIMVPLFITEKFPDEFVNKRIPPTITKNEIFDAIDTRVVYHPISVSYEKARAWMWDKKEEVKVEDSSDVFSEYEILIEIDEEEQNKDASAEEKNEEDSEDTTGDIPSIYKSRIVGQ